MNTNSSFGDWLKQRRKALDLTQAEIADQVGCAVTTIQKIEANIRRPSKQIAERLANVLALTPEAYSDFVGFARHIPRHTTELSPDLNSLRPMHNLPAQSTSFVGRENELAQIANRLNDPTCRLLTLIGVGGIGKTRLAVQAAANQLENFANGVYFVTLSPVSSTTLIAAAIASVLQISFNGHEEPNLQLATYLRGKHMLLIMDNYEHLLGGAALMTDILSAAPGLKLLVTSRERLNLHEEWVVQIDGLAYPTSPIEDELSRYSAVQLFLQTARRLQPDFLIENNQEAVMDICRAVEGMPLGIELAVTWLRVMPCHQIAGQIRHDLDFLATPLRNVPDRHRSLRALFDHSWGLLSESEQQALMRLSVFQGGIHPDAAQQIAQAPLSLMVGLVDKSLIRLNAVGRYELHELLRQFASDKLVEADKLAETEYQHFQYFLGMAEQLTQWFFGPQHLIGMDRLEAELDNFRAALNWAARVNEPQLGLRLASALGWFWNRRGYWKEGFTWIERFLDACDNVPILTRALAVHHALELASELAYWDHVNRWFDEALRLVHDVHDPWHKAWLFNSLGLVTKSGVPVIVDYAQQALALFMQLGDKWGICETLSRLGYDLCQSGDFAQAEVLQKQGVKLAQSEGDKGVLAWLLLLSAYNHWFQGKIDARTEGVLLQSLELFRELRFKNGAAGALLYLGRFARLRHDHPQALDRFQECLRLMQQIGGGDFTVEGLTCIAELFCIRSQPERGTQLLGAVESSIDIVFLNFPLVVKEIRTDYDRSIALARTMLDEPTFNSIFAAGQAMTIDRAVDYALANTMINLNI